MAEQVLAVLVDFENMARPGSKSRGDFDIHLVLNRLAEKGRVIVKRAYADWGRYREAKVELQNAGLELIEMPSAREGAKNRADIKLAVDAMELAYSRDHVGSFVIVSGDSDFTPLVGKLRELNKRVVGLGNRESSSELLIANCDEFIFYDSLAAGSTGRASRSGRVTDPVELLSETLQALQREGVEWPLASIVKDSMRRKNPAFDEGDYAYSTFSKFLEEAARKGIARLETDPRSGTYRVELADGSAAPPLAAPPPSGEESAAEGDGRRRRRRRRSSEPAPAGMELPPGAEIFEVVVTPTPDADLGQLPPIDQPISYEHMVLLTSEVDAEVPELLEVSDVPDEGPPPRSARRRRRRITTEDAEVTVAEPEAPAVPDQPDVQAQEPEAEPQAPAAAAAAAPAEETPAGRRRVRRRSQPPAEVTEVPAAEAPVAAPAEAPVEEEAKPKRRTRRTAPQAD